MKPAPKPARTAARWARVAVGSQRKMIADNRHPDQETAQKRRLSIEADYGVIDRQCWDCRERRRCVKITLVGVETKPNSSNAPRHQRILRGPNHAHGDIGFPSQQIFHAIGKNKFDLYAGVRTVELAEHGRQYFGPHYIARGNAHSSRRVARPSGSGARDGACRGRHRFGMGRYISRSVGRDQTARRAYEYAAPKLCSSSTI